MNFSPKFSELNQQLIEEPDHTLELNNQLFLSSGMLLLLTKFQMAVSCNIKCTI